MLSRLPFCLTCRGLQNKKDSDAEVCVMTTCVQLTRYDRRRARANFVCGIESSAQTGCGFRANVGDKRRRGAGSAAAGAGTARSCPSRISARLAHLRAGARGGEGNSTLVIGVSASSKADLQKAHTACLLSRGGMTAEVDYEITR